MICLIALFVLVMSSDFEILCPLKRLRDLCSSRKLLGVGGNDFPPYFGTLKMYVKTVIDILARYTAMIDLVPVGSYLSKYSLA